MNWLSESPFQHRTGKATEGDLSVVWLATGPHRDEEIELTPWSGFILLSFEASTVPGLWNALDKCMNE